MLTIAHHCPPGLTSLMTLLLALTTGIAPLAAQPATDSAANTVVQSPTWVWVESENAVARQMQQDMLLASAPVSARLKIAADFCTAAVLINDRPVCVVGPYAATVSLDVTQSLGSGRNQIAVRLQKSAGPSAVALSLTVADVNGPQQLLSSSNWTVPAGSVLEDYGTVRPGLWGIGAASLELSGADNYEQWRLATGDARPASLDAKLRIRPGFRVTRIRDARPDEGSWVSMTFDADGRLIIAREDKGLLRFGKGERGFAAGPPEVINQELLECRGLLFAHGALYANANNSKAIYRLQDLDADGSLERVEKLREYSGGVGHGRNDLVLGPDGWIWAIHGDSVDAPAAGTSRDITSPLRDSRRGPVRQEGYVVRISPDGSQSEVVCTGLRNPFGIDFNAAGDAFTYDADNEFDMGTPWYRPTRIWQLSAGLDFGWRVAQGQWPPYFPDRADNSVWQLDTGKGSPTSVMFGSKLNFAPAWRDCLYVLDWAYGRVLAVHTAPRGSVYRMAGELFLQGVPLNVTDIAAGPDGAMYLITGGRKTQSALYRVTMEQPDVTPAADSLHEQQCTQYALRQQEQRRAAEQWLRSESSVQDAEERLRWIERTLAESDPQLQAMARTVLEQMPVEHWGGRLLQVSDDRVFVEGALSLVRAGSQEQVTQLLRRMSTLVSGHSEALSAPVWLRQASVRLQLIQEMGIRFPELIREGDGAAGFVRDWLLSDLQRCAAAALVFGAGEQTTTLRYRLVAAAAEVGLPLTGAGTPESELLRSLLQSPQQQDQLTALLGLRKQLAGADSSLIAFYFGVLNEGTRWLGGDGMAVFLGRLREDAVASLPESLRDTYREAPAASVTDEVLTVSRPVVQRWRVDSLLPLLEQHPAVNDPAAGARLYREALCSRCHRFGTEGRAVGPELTSVGRRFSRSDLLASIVEPSKVVAEPYRLTHVSTLDGLTRTGRLLAEGDYRSELIRLNTEILRPGQFETIDKKQVESLQPVELSPMPVGLLDSLTPSEINSLLNYLQSGPGTP